MPKVRSSYTVAKKLQILDWHKENGANFHKTSLAFAIDRKTLRDWLKKEDVLRNHNYSFRNTKRKIGCGRKPLCEEMDEELFEFFENERQNGRAVSNKLLSQKATEIAVQLKVENFKASDRYISNWKKRYDIVTRKGTNASQKTPEELKSVVDSFFSLIKERRKINEYTMYNIANMDQTMCRFDNPANRTNEKKGETSIRIASTGCSKRGFTVALAAKANGYKLPAFCIFKEVSGRIPPKVWAKLKVPKNIRVTATKNGWMQADTLQEWIDKIWGPNEDDVRRLLIIDQAPIHKPLSVRDALKNVDTDLVLIPPGCTMILQPADVCWNKPFKVKMCEQWGQFISRGEKTPKGNFKMPSRQEVLTWVSHAWDSISEDVIKRSFLRCGISNALDGSENGEYHDNLCRAVTPSSDELCEELIDLIFDDDVDDDSDFSGFSHEE